MKTLPFIERVEWEPENDAPHSMHAIDELVSGPVDYVHIERMTDCQYWMAIGKGAVRQIVIFHGNRNAKIFARTEPDD